MNCFSTTATKSSNSSKYRLCVHNRRVNFHTRSIGLSSGLYGGRNNNSILPRCFSSQSDNSSAWWYRALSNITNAFLPRLRFFISVSRNTLNDSASKMSNWQQVNVPSSIRTPPKYAVLLRVGANITGLSVQVETTLRTEYRAVGNGIHRSTISPDFFQSVFS